MFLASLVLALVPSLSAAKPLVLPTGWPSHGGDAQHTALASVAVQHLGEIKWSTLVDLNPRYSGNSLLSHYGSPVVSRDNVIVVGQKQEVDSGFKVNAFNATTGSLLWTEDSDYIMPPHGWTPSFGPCISGLGLTKTVQMAVWPMAGGRIAYRAIGNNGARPQTIAFYGNAEFAAHPTEYTDSIRICTPLTPGPDGYVYFGFIALADTPAHLKSGIAKVNFSGGTTASAEVLSGDPAVNQVKMNAAPAITAAGDALYVTLTNGGWGRGILTKVRTSNLQEMARVPMLDPKSGLAAIVEDLGTACPMIGPDGDVYVGVLENPFPDNHDRGWLLHYSGDLSETKIPGAFGWDDTPSVVPASAVPSYTGSSPYLLVSKYNNYAGVGGDGVNKIALLDPRVAATEVISGIQTMVEVATIAGPTSDPEYVASHPNAVREWCVNSAVVDALGHSVLLNCEDGILYRWSFDNFQLAESIRLTDGIGEAYTTTMISNDGLIFGISNARLYCVGNSSLRKKR